MPENQTPAPPPEGTEGTEQPQTFTQADLDRVVKERVQRERAKFADYDTLKAQAEGAKTAEQRIADLEKRIADGDAAEARRVLVAKAAGAHGITDPDDIRLFLTGSDEETLTAQAERLATRGVEQREQGTYVPNEGRPPSIPGDSELREFTRQLFDSKE